MITETDGIAFALRAATVLLNGAAYVRSRSLRKVMRSDIGIALIDLHRSE
jgi:hypothetical protein